MPYPPADLVSVTPTLTASSAYSSGNAVGGLQTLTVQLLLAQAALVLESLTVLDAANQKVPLTVLFFSGTTPVTDKTAFSWGANFSKCLGKVEVATADYDTIASKALATVTDLDLILKPAAGAVVYAVVLTTGTPTWGTTSDLTFRYGFRLS